MDIHETALRLELPEITRTALKEIRIMPEREETLRQMFLLDTEAFVQNTDTVELLWLYLKWTEETRREYRRRGIPDSVFWDSMRDIGIWCRDHTAKTGTCGMGEPLWVAKSLKLEVIRLGRLQFEPRYLEGEIAAGQRRCPAGLPILEVHIPAEEKLEFSSALDSLRRAKDFFARHFGWKAELMHCHSWLLSPALAALLPENANILRFQSLFRVYQTDDGRQAEERVFGRVCEDAASYPETTALQRSMKAYLLQGNTVGMGSGVCDFPE